MEEEIISPQVSQLTTEENKDNNNDNDKKEKKVKRPGRLNDSKDVQLSKTLSYILRHGAIKEKLKLRSDGFIQLDELLKRPKLKNFTVDDIRRVVADNDKQRFAIIEENLSDGRTVELIRANQGHSLTVKEIDLTPFKDPSEMPTAIHGTYLRHWDSILQQGLKPGKRTHMHFASGFIGDEHVISGMRHSCEIFIYLDVEKCFKDEIQFYLSPINGVILSEGHPKTKTIPSDYFKSVQHKDGTILFPKNNSS